MSGKTAVLALAALGLMASTTASAGPLPPRPGATRNIAAACGTRDGWAEPAPPARVFGGTYYVGTCGITALLVETQAGLVLVDGGIREAAPLVLENIRALGFSPRMVRWIIASHEHYDHVGALGVIQRETGAKLVASSLQLRAFQSGKPDPDDPQTSLLDGHGMEPLTVNRVVQNGARLVVGEKGFLATATPTHSPGSTSWSWRECEGSVCRTIAYADSATAISSDGYRFSDHPRRVAGVRLGLAAIGAMPCDILVTPHPVASDLFARLSGVKPLVQFGACRTYAMAAHKRFEQRLADETAAPAK